MTRALLLFATALCLTAQPGAGIKATEVGHEFRQDDLPAIAVAPDGSVWVAWVSFAGDRDDVAIRHYQNGKWQNLQWVPGTSGDSWLPQVAVDKQNRVWVVWSQQSQGNWDLYARRFDPQRQEWDPLERLTSDPSPDIYPRLASDEKGGMALTWQAFRGGKSNIFVRTFSGEKWSAEVRVTNHASNDWEPSVAIDSKGGVWVAYDSYRNGNYDVFLSHVRNGKVEGGERSVAVSPRFEARATVATDSMDRVWVAWESGLPNWGKDTGYIIRERQPGNALGGDRRLAIRCWADGGWREPKVPLPELFQKQSSYAPHVFSDGRGSVWLLALVRHTGPLRADFPPRPGYWELWATRLEGSRWSDPFALPNSKGRMASRVNASRDRDQNLWLTWPTDGRKDSLYHRPQRHQVFAGILPASPAAGVLELKAPAEEPVKTVPAHPDEAGDVRAVRSNQVMIGGKRNVLLRGDFHRHTELSWDGGGVRDGSLQDFFRYMIDAAAMDFGAATDHQGGAWPYWWWYTQKMTDMHLAPGAFVPIFGYERSALYPDGHRNVLFASRADSRVTPFFMRDSGKSPEMEKWKGAMAGAQSFGLPRPDEGDEPGSGTGALAINDTKLLYEDIRARKGLAISHTSGTLMGTDWRDNDPVLEPVVEIFQGCRTSYEQVGAPHVADAVKDKEHIQRTGYFPAGLVRNAWAKGYKLGVITSSDHGSTHLSYAMVYAEFATREGILDAIRRRHTYGATDNIVLEVRMGSHFMGDEFPLAKAIPLEVKARGTNAISKVEVIKDGQVVFANEPSRKDLQFAFKDTGEIAGRHYYYVRLLQTDGMIAWSSPLFVNYR